MCTSESPARSQLAGEALAQPRTSTDEGGRRANMARPATCPRLPLCVYPLLVTRHSTHQPPLTPCSSSPSSPPPEPTSASPSLMEKTSQSLNQALSSSFTHATKVGTRQHFRFTNKVYKPTLDLFASSTSFVTARRYALIFNTRLNPPPLLASLSLQTPLCRPYGLPKHKSLSKSLSSTFLFNPLAHFTEVL